MPSPAAADRREVPPFDLTHPPDPINRPPHRRRSPASPQPTRYVDSTPPASLFLLSSAVHCHHRLSERWIGRENVGWNWKTKGVLSRSVLPGQAVASSEMEGLTAGVGRLTLEGNGSHVLLGGDRGMGGSQFALPQHRTQLAQKPIDFLDDDYDSRGEMSV
ncbi:hypothetical protein ACHAXA_009868 [Cyclostephanos tholiformis]|uniref:Uncharacterized protein n=1 Tax=Cyclostephanos tholiformis TaxID=382380 RepID=A0ABD3RDM3_9STRA